MPGVIWKLGTVADPRFSNVSTCSISTVDDSGVRVSDGSDSLFDFGDGQFLTGSRFQNATAHATGGQQNGSGPLISKDVGLIHVVLAWRTVTRFFIDDGTTTASIISDALMSPTAHGMTSPLLAMRRTISCFTWINRSMHRANDDTAGDFANDNDLVIDAFNASCRIPSDSTGTSRLRGFLQRPGAG